MLVKNIKTTPTMAGTILVTGANGSLAIHAARHLLKYNPDYALLLTVRDASDRDQNTVALRNIIAEHSRANPSFEKSQVSIRQLDHSHLDAVHQFAHGVSQEIANGDLPRLVSIVCNAYSWNLSRPLEKTGDGFEKTIQVTHLAHVVLVLRLLGSFHPTQPGRIVQFSTDGIFPGKNGLEKIPPAIPDDMELLARPPPDPKDNTWAYGFQRYANTKLAAVMWIHALNRRLEKARQISLPNSCYIANFSLVRYLGCKFQTHHRRSHLPRQPERFEGAARQHAFHGPNAVHPRCTTTKATTPPRGPMRSHVRGCGQGCRTPGR
jgi:NAD(P)-dependent dehydrogenase (short-subunit alcohol dehydrogenase family)